MTHIVFHQMTNMIKMDRACMMFQQDNNIAEYSVTIVNSIKLITSDFPKKI